LHEVQHFIGQLLARPKMKKHVAHDRGAAIDGADEQLGAQFIPARVYTL
jgi:hypothetical protein